MTITTADIDARLPRVSTWPSTTWDLTDPEERAEAVTWLLAVYSAAEGTGDAERGATGHTASDPGEPWGPPKPGTHESDACWGGNGFPFWTKRYITQTDLDDTRGGFDEYHIARTWSRANAPT